MPGLIDEPMTTFYEMVNFWARGNNLTSEQLAEIAPKITGKSDSSLYTKADWANIRYHLSSLLP